jgi:hypothetical protein
MRQGFGMRQCAKVLACANVFVHFCQAYIFVYFTAPIFWVYLG